MPWKHKPFGWGKASLGETLFPPVQEATVAVLNQVRAVVDREHSHIQEIVFNVDTVEPPSVELAIQLMLDQVSSQLKFKSTAASTPRINPRESTAKRPLWKFSGDKPEPAVDDPGPILKQVCAEVAANSNDCMASWELSKKEAESLTVDDVLPSLAVMVYPPAVRSGFVSTEWVRRVQLAAAQIACNIEMANDVSLPDSSVADVVLGPLDWSVDSALVALAQRAVENIELMDEVRRIAGQIVARIPDEGTWSSRDICEGAVQYLDVFSDSPATGSSSNN